MFICDPCLELNFKNFTAFRSAGICEICGTRDACADIQSADLIASDNRRKYFGDGCTYTALPVIPSRAASKESF